MMTRTSRWLKWAGAATVLLAAAPIAYADAARHTGSPSSGAVSPGPDSASARAAGCAADADDFAGAYLVAEATGPAGLTGEELDLHADGSVSVFSFGRAAATGAWHADGGALTWTVDGVSYASRPGLVACADQAHAGQVTGFTAAAADGSDSLTLQRF
ncbi:hypothetical protein KDL01_24790 [Actinospica durhamensis]|uniref:Uncharacterized protein n=1 Tax=Actinospica durhamensis TaxID=1508375 RepID=A0A941IQQ7_9ACTN|nr:hypothetical protein [Actinospica durhamensis]MBR7836519.1 hypothetical protein [Actinospica durhamensis]